MNTQSTYFNEFLFFISFPNSGHLSIVDNLYVPGSVRYLEVLLCKHNNGNYSCDENSLFSLNIS